MKVPGVGYQWTMATVATNRGGQPQTLTLPHSHTFTLSVYLSTFALGKSILQVYRGICKLNIVLGRAALTQKENLVKAKT